MEDDIRNKMERAVVTRLEEVEANKQKYQESSSKKLFFTIQKKLQTSFIGALSVFEEIFGDLWGRGVHEWDLSDEQKTMYLKWNEARTRILNNGNNQIRAVQNEISQYTVIWNRYNYYKTGGD